MKTRTKSETLLSTALRSGAAAFVAIFLSNSEALAAPAAANAASDEALPPVGDPDVTLNLIKLMVRRHLISQVDADDLIHEARQKAATARAKTAQAKSAVKPASGQPAAVAAAPESAPPSEPGDLHVPYVPEPVKREIMAQVEQDMERKAKAENWAGRERLPDWADKIQIAGDFRLRFEEDLYDSRNSNQLINFNAINTGSPVDITNPSAIPYLNTTEDRQRLRVRGRLGLTDAIQDDFTVGIRISTGSDNTPVSPNQTLGNDFNRFDVTFDRLYLDYHPTAWLSVVGGRFANPFFSTDLQFSDNLSFDGVALSLRDDSAATGVMPFLTAGAFPVENTALDFQSDNFNKTASVDAWLYAAQLGVTWKPTPDYRMKFGAAYYLYQNLEGRISSPCSVLTASDSCDTDNSRTIYEQKGNTMTALRNIELTGATNQPLYQYFGLASPFRLLDLTGEFDWQPDPGFHVAVDADFVMNLAFDRSRILAKVPANNFDQNGNFVSGNKAFLAKVTVGAPQLTDWWDWSASVGYKYLEADSLVDAFNDIDFHNGGTNAKGYFLIGNLGLGSNVWLSGRYFSATEVTGQPLSIDVLQLDLNARF
jgi:hypothetical protein